MCCSFVHNVTELGAVTPVDEKEDETDMYDVPDKKPTSARSESSNWAQQATSGQTALIALTHTHLCG